ncbi:hypothetical protein LF1_22770 [Rubripirellula obstinata]|uniref:Uncharacterized protein n=1 Tax=Rubripirellula obstinata TaxID=406547 RepID=A0A5B1CJN5_9BACT|nr:hypothetical protein [Rubripirellula obstinata]KAA1259740.1 hypothetical protein LF1_22770 [Rubripirellula obstinata]
MDREELLKLIDTGPVKITMNDGSQYTVNDHKDVAVGDLTAYVLVRDPRGILRGTHLSLVCMASVEELQEA